MIRQRPSASRRQRSLDELARLGGMLESVERRATAERLEAAGAQRRRGKIQLTVAIVASLTGLVLLLWTLPPPPPPPRQLSATRDVLASRSAAATRVTMSRL